ncbi:MAG TPA: isoprenylcysteine carboxylmethyltransferase family protein [Acidimicrobiales bacterium]|jgi:protein-S-isoprenylcysteine O-methyltransferase Ste14|nr:isoprenylcysteine carboxylmethyltransferase family protein [Acidimicrobiales bacterium]
MQQLVRLGANLVGAAGAAYFAAVTLEAYLRTHRLLGVGFFVEQMVVVVVYLVRRPARQVTRRSTDWVLAFGGTFVPVLLRPDGTHPALGVNLGIAFGVLGLAICLWSFLALGRSFGFAAADRGLVRDGPYAVVRHPIYASYLLLQCGYVLQSVSLRNLVVFLMASGFNVGRALVEDELLAGNPAHAAYRGKVRWRLVPGLW